jgi:hypothetical protein
VIGEEEKGDDDSFLLLLLRLFSFSNCVDIYIYIFDVVQSTKRRTNAKLLI